MITETNYAEQFFSSINIENDTIRKNAEMYPFSAVARFLQLYQAKKNNEPLFDQLAKQSAVYFNNLPWIQYQLAGINQNGENHPKEDGSRMVDQLSPDQGSNDQLSTQETVVINNEISYEPSGADVAVEEQIIAHDTPHEIELIANEQITQISDQEIKYETHTLGTSNEGQTIAAEEPDIDQSAVNEQITQISDQEIKYETQTLGISDEGEIINAEETYIDQSAVNEQITQIPDQEIKYETETLGTSDEGEIINTEETYINQSAVNEQITQIPVHDVNYETHATGASEGENNQQQENGATPLTSGEQKTSVPFHHPENEDEPTAFEPLHTIDYFASQGIRISEEALENDRLGKQVKSFTAWLKSMKKLHPGQLPEQNEVIEKIIQSSAEVSNQSADVLTEAMAEVLIKQEKREKAIEMYEKLSLMNPSKSAYFAAKIESLKII